MADRIRQDEWLAELARLSLGPSEGKTTSELAAEAGVSTKTMALRLNKAKAMGWVRVVTKQVESLSGRMTPVAAYIISIPEKGGKK